MTPEDIDNIKLTIEEKIEKPHGLTYSLKLQNNSKHVIKQNNVYLSYPIKTENGSRENEFKVEAKNNKLDIQPGEELLLTIFAPIEMYVGNDQIDINNPEIEIIGYLKEVEELKKFYKGGGYRAMEDF